MAGDDDFWNKVNQLVVSSHIVIDRPKGSRHPRYADMIYPLDYGYLSDTISPDADGIDVWQGTGNDRRVVGLICTIDTVKRDSEIKLLLGCTDAEIELVRSFHQSNSMSCLLIRSSLMIKSYSFLSASDC